MNLFKISLVSFLLSFFVILPVFAAGVPTTPNTSTQKATVIADVNVHNSKIVSQNGNIFKISFDISNNEGAQAGLKYSVSLIKETTNSQFLADQYIYPEVLSINANTTLNKEIVYNAPTNLTGDYTLLVTIKNSSGFPLGLGVAGKVKLTSTVNTVEILPETCSLSVVGEKGNIKYNLTQGVDITSAEKLLLNCSAVNSSNKIISAIPSYETHYRTLSGDVVSQEGGDVTPVPFTVGEKKNISLVLPKATKPQAYDIKVLLNSGETSSNFVVVHYVLRGASATILNFSLDKDYYKNNDTAKLSLSWAPSADSFPGSRGGATESSGITLNAHITDANQKDCITPISQSLSGFEPVEISAPIIKDCNNPQVSIDLKDANGNMLDQKNFSFESQIQQPEKETKPSTLIYIIFGVLVVVGLAVYFIKLKNKSNEANIQ